MDMDQLFCLHIICHIPIFINTSSFVTHPYKTMSVNGAKPCTRLQDLNGNSKVFSMQLNLFFKKIA